MQVGGLDKLNEDILSLSSRTNKILLNSDESSENLRSSLDSLRSVVSTFDKQIHYLDNKDRITRIEKQLETINGLVMSNVQSNKIFNQTFMYLAEWVDKTDDKLSKITDTMVKTTDIEKLFDKLGKKFDKQQEKIKSLEEKIDKLTKAKVSAKETDVKTLVSEVLSKLPATGGKADASLSKKVDGIDKQLAVLGQNIAKITSYVDE